ncbi:hypothetical protein CK218_11245 [Mesorhizobium sp. WSM3879]|uniref:hypothetical protein n=1 Tax=Mesorhizobium sp. WSM3879 TaxID=2029406 RepID=UPI000BAF9FD8|nr:hypothetical protein [Mesorhizobium sp. WSM3879]PBB80970.1 hypothetical protein CK218_11245 [Mesorhizobium sp. WSM3879]
MSHDLAFPTIADGQADGQWQTSNDADAAIGNATTDTYSVDFSAGNVTLNSTQYRSGYTFKPSAALAAARTLTLPAVKRPFTFHNSDATYTVTLKSTDGASPETAMTVVVLPGQLFFGYTNGSSPGLFGFASSTGSSLTGTYYDFGGYFEAAPSTSGGVFGRVRIARNITIAANMSGSYGGVSTNPVATYDVDVKDDGVSIGTISISTGGVVTFTTVSGTSKSVAAGSEIRFTAPINSPPDTTIAGLNFVIAATVA